MLSVLWIMFVLVGSIAAVEAGWIGFRVTGIIVAQQRYNRRNAIELLRSGRPDDWNALREADSSWAPDLRSAVLRGCNLTGANLRRAALDESDLANAILDNADLTESSLTRARLVRSSLRGTLLDRANLTEADLSDADLTGTSFEGTILTGTILEEERPSRELPIVTSLSPSGLIHSIQRDPGALDSLKPEQFEELVAEILQAQGLEVELSTRTGDGGKDIVAVQNTPFGRNLILVEAKLYSAAHPVGVSMVRSLLGVTELEKANRGILVTTSSFTRAAEDLAGQYKHRLQLADRDQLLAWIRSLGSSREANSGEVTESSKAPAPDV